MGLSPTALKKSSLETIGELVVGNTSCRRVKLVENALHSAGTFLEIVRIMVCRYKQGKQYYDLMLNLERIRRLPAFINLEISRCLICSSCASQLDLATVKIVTNDSSLQKTKYIIPLVENVWTYCILSLPESARWWSHWADDAV